MPKTLIPINVKDRRLLDRDFNDTIKSLRAAWKAGRQDDAAQCAHDLSCMATDPQDWMAQFHPDGK